MLSRAGVVGDPAGHSLSPAIHRAGYAAHGLSWAYDAYTVAPADFAQFVAARAADPAWVGLSVTAPHKSAAARLGAADEATRLVGGANTILFGAQPRVANTDVPGFVRAWREHALAAPSAAAILGNGATARSIAVALAELGARELVILARDPARAVGLVALAQELGLSAAARPLTDSIEAVDLVANTIPPAATAEIAERLAGRTKAVFDVVYDPWPTPLATAAARQGRHTLDGLDLLAGQAVDQFRLMTGHEVGFAACRAAAEQELSSRREL